MSKVNLVKNAMLATIRYPWEHGVCAQAIYEMGDMITAVAMAHDAVLRAQPDGRLAVINNNIAVTDPAANGEVVYRAYEYTKNEMYKNAADKMLCFLLDNAPKTDKGAICHNEISFHEGYSPYQIWVDSIYMAPPFLAVMGKLDQALFQIESYLDYLYDEKTNLLFHIYDAGTKQYVRKKLWVTGIGWALLGMARVIDTAIKNNREDISQKLIDKSVKILDALLQYQLSDGRFHDIVDDENTFIDGTGAMMTAAFIYRGLYGGWLDKKYEKNAKLVIDTMDNFVDEFGIIHEVCGCPHFLDVGTSAESMASYLMMHTFYEKYKG